LPIQEVGPAIARALRRPTADVTRALRGTRGVIDLRLSEIDAEIVKSILARQGIPTRVAAEEAAPKLPRAVILLDADPLPKGLLIQRASGREQPGLLPWRHLKIAAVGAVTFTRFPTRDVLESASNTGDLEVDRVLAAALPSLRLGFLVSGGGPFGLREPTPHTPARKPPITETVHCLDLLTDGPIPRYRILASRFIYDYLGERMKLCSAENFRTLLTDLATFAPDILLSGTTLSFLSKPKSDHHRFQTELEFDAYVRWLSAWDRLFR
jgi:hypothetical protein